MLPRIGCIRCISSSPCTRAEAFSVCTRRQNKRFIQRLSTDIQTISLIKLNILSLPLVFAFVYVTGHEKFVSVCVDAFIASDCCDFHSIVPHQLDVNACNSVKLLNGWVCREYLNRFVCLCLHVRGRVSNLLSFVVGSITLARSFLLGATARIYAHINDTAANTSNYCVSPVFANRCSVRLLCKRCRVRNRLAFAFWYVYAL